jgi:hypothetical protein
MDTNSSISSESAYGKCKLTYTFIGTDDEIDCVLDYIGKMYDECDFNNEDVVNNETAEKDMVNSPAHYNQSSMECIDEMILVFGKQVTADFCLGNVWKYRNRAPYKGNPIEDAKKADWYMMKYKELKDEMNKPVIGYTTSIGTYNN